MLLKKFKNAFWFVEKHCKSEIWTLKLILVMHFKYYQKLLHTLPLIQVWPFRQLFCPWLVDLASSSEDLSVFSHFLSLRHQCAWNERIAPSVWAKIQICCPCQLPTKKQKKDHVKLFEKTKMHLFNFQVSLSFLFLIYQNCFLL